MQIERDDQVLIDAKNYIKNNLKKGDNFTTSMVQRQFKTGYNLASRILERLQADGFIKMDKDRIKAPKVVFNYAQQPDSLPF